MRVGVVTTSYPRGPGDGAGAFVADRVDELLAVGHDVDVLAAAGASSPACALERGGRLTITRLPARVGAGPDLFAGAGAPETLEAAGVASWLGALRFTTALASEVRARAPRWSRVESHWLAPCALAVTAAAPALPHRATAHSGDVALLERLPLGASFARLLAAGGADLVFVSEALRRRYGALVGRPCGRVETLPVPRARFPRASRPGPDLGLRASLGLVRPTIVAVGRLVPIKGFDLLVRAVAGISTAPHLALVGEGPERPRLRRLADGLGVDLRLPGRIARDEVGAWLRAADLYAQPSRVLSNGRTEGLPVATLEALATGLPAVVSDSGGLAELRDEASGVDVVPAGDVAALSAALRRRLAGLPSSAARIVAGV